MDAAIIKGMDVVEKQLGYLPSFHDDHIYCINIEPCRIEITMKPEFLQNNSSQNQSGLYKLIFHDAQQFNFCGELYGVVSIVGDILFQRKGDSIETIIETSLGAEGCITSKEVEIALL